MGLKITNREDKTYIVLGVPHSATSFIAQSLSRNGVNMGRESHRNLRYEDLVFVSINKRILRKFGKSNFVLPSEEEILKVDVDNKIKIAIKSKKGKSWGFKDPRASLTIKKYFPHLDGDVYLICCFRKPDRIMRGREKRVNKKFIDHYNKAIISAIKEFVEL
jgi:hypothetical protein